MKSITVHLDRHEPMHGWDPQTGWPTRERLTGLDIGDVYGPMVEGTARARGGSQDVF
jgi:hypothetical protein